MPPWRWKYDSTCPSRCSSILTLGPCRRMKSRPSRAADEEAGGVPEQGARPDEADQRDQADLALAGDHAAHDDGRLPGSDEAHERAGLEKRQRSHEQVGPGAEGHGDVLDQPLGVGQVRERAGDDQDHEGERHDRQRDLLPVPLHGRVSVTSAPSMAVDALSAASPSAKTPKVGGTRSRDPRGERAVGAQRPQRRRQLGAQRRAPRLPDRSPCRPQGHGSSRRPVASAARGRAASRLRDGSARAQAIELRVDAAVDRPRS